MANTEEPTTQVGAGEQRDEDALEGEERASRVAPLRVRAGAKDDVENLMAGQAAGDALVIASGGAGALWAAGVVGWLGAIGHMLLAWLLLVFLAVIVLAICTASRETRARKLVGWAIVCGLLVPVYSGWLGAGSWLLAAGALLWTAARTLRAHPRQDAAFKASLAAKVGSGALAAYLRRVAKEGVEPPTEVIVEGRLGLTTSVAPELRSLVDGALADYVHLLELSGEMTKQGADRGLRADAEAVMAELLVRAPQVSRLLAMSAERIEDRAGQAAAAAAMAGLRRRAEALHDVASAALQLAARGDQAAVEGLRAQVEALHALREAHEEVERALDA